MWSVYYDPRLEDWLETIPTDVKAKILRIVDMLVEGFFISHGTVKR
ncbi:MAG: hypothetical protein NTU69_08935 [Proteobacteria bacterium]|nr:hypothetical protein [Pseudomonadota bacterium]